METDVSTTKLNLWNKIQADLLTIFPLLTEVVTVTSVAMGNFHWCNSKKKTGKQLKQSLKKFSRYFHKKKKLVNFKQVMGVIKYNEEEQRSSQDIWNSCTLIFKEICTRYSNRNYWT